MKNLKIISLVCLIISGTTGFVRAEDPYAYISIPQESANLGTILLWDTIIPDALTIKVHSNCLHGPIVASVSSLKHRRGGIIDNNRILIRTDFTGGFVSLAKPVMISGSTIGSHDISVDFKVKANGLNDRPGKYTGTIAFTVLPPV